MLSVSFNMAAVVAMLVSIVAPGCLAELDSLNSPTAQPFLLGPHNMHRDHCSFKGIALELSILNRIIANQNEQNNIYNADVDVC